jgi:hypothetical protein
VGKKHIFAVFCCVFSLPCLCFKTCPRASALTCRKLWCLIKHVLPPVRYYTFTYLHVFQRTSNQPCFYTNASLHQNPSTHTYSTCVCATLCFVKLQCFYIKRFLHQQAFTPASFTPASFYTDIFFHKPCCFTNSVFTQPLVFFKQTFVQPANGRQAEGGQTAEGC